ncbi:hypothetical protein GMJAKD_17190 [Candidatus Electrothrix aarhusensis]
MIFFMIIQIMITAAFCLVKKRSTCPAGDNMTTWFSVPSKGMEKQLVPTKSIQAHFNCVTFWRDIGKSRHSLCD